LFRGTTFVPERQAPGPHLIDASFPGDLRFRGVLRTLSRGSLSVKTSKTTPPVSIRYSIRLIPSGLNSLYALPRICQEKCGSSTVPCDIRTLEPKVMENLQTEEKQADRTH